MSLFKSFNTGQPTPGGNPAGASVYVHSHFQHFKKTVEQKNIKSKTNKILTTIASSINKELTVQILTANQLEETILKAGYGKIAGDVKDHYRKAIKDAMVANPLASLYVDERDATRNIEVALKQGYQILNKYDRKGIEKYVKDEIKEFINLIQIMGDFISNLYKELETIYKTPEEKESIKAIAGMVARTQGFFNKDFKKYTKSKGAKTKAISNLKNLGKEITNVRTLGDLNKFTNTVNKNINATIYELMVGQSIFNANVHGEQVLYDSFAKALKKGGLEHTGTRGGSNTTMGTTDFIFNFGGYKVGWDIKSSRESYTKTEFAGKGSIFYALQKTILGSSEFQVFKKIGVNDADYLKWFAYTLTNVAALQGLDESGSAPDNAEKYDSGWVSQNITSILEKVILITAVLNFLDSYLENFNNDLRKQIVILLGDEAIFISEFLAGIRKVLLPFIINPSEAAYNTIGFISFGNDLKSLGGLALKTGGVKQLWEKKKNILQRTETETSLQSNSSYPIIFSQLDGDFKRVTERILGSNFWVSLRFDFDLFK